MPLPIYVVDAFTDRAFAGNPAAVCLLNERKEDAWMQNVAAEMKHAETAFLLGEAGAISLRWFTPAVEVDLCGHATLASAHILFELGLLKEGDNAVFNTRSGYLTAAKIAEGIRLDFPAEPATKPPACDIEALMVALRLGVTPSHVAENRMDILVELPHEDLVHVLEPDMVLLGQIETRGVIVTAASAQPDFDFVSRFFAPAAGVPEDPVTGSAHCCLGPYWGEKLGKTSLIGYQASHRGGIVRVDLAGDRVHMTGQAVTVLEGALLC